MDTGSSLIKAKFTTHDLDLILDLREHAEVIGLDENVPNVFKRRKQKQSLLQIEIDARWRLLDPWEHPRERSGDGRGCPHLDVPGDG